MDADKTARDKAAVGDDAKRSLPTWMRRLCGGTAVALIVWGAYMLLWDQVDLVCHQEIAEAADGTTPRDQVVQVCEPMALTDPRVGLFLLVVLLLLAPFFAEIEVPGILRVKRQLREAEQDVDGLRHSIALTQQQVALVSAASARSSARSSPKQEVNVYTERPQESGAGLSAAQESPASDVEPSEGAYAQVAFNAGVLGLPLLLPDWGREAKLIGFVVAADGSLAISQVSEDVPAPAIERALVLVNADVTEPKVDIEESWIVTAPALDHDGAVVGALAAIIEWDQAVPDGTSGGPDELDEMVAEVTAAAGAYARLLIDLLGETGRIASSPSETERGRPS